MLQPKEATPSSPYTQTCVPIPAFVPAQTFMQSGQAGMRQNRRPAHAGAVTESKHSNYNLDLKINSRRERQDSLPHISICIESQQTQRPSQRSQHQEAGFRGCEEGAKLCQHPLCREDRAMRLMIVTEGSGGSNQQLIAAGRGESLWDQHTTSLHSANTFEGADTLPNFAND